MGTTKTKKKMITMDMDEQDHKEGGRIQGVISPGRRWTPLRRGRIVVGRAPNLKNYHILLLEEDN